MDDNPPNEEDASHLEFLKFLQSNAKVESSVKGSSEEDAFIGDLWLGDERGSGEQNNRPLNEPEDKQSPIPIAESSGQDEGKSTVAGEKGLENKPVIEAISSLSEAGKLDIYVHKEPGNKHESIYDEPPDEATADEQIQGGLVVDDEVKLGNDPQCEKDKYSLDEETCMPSSKTAPAPPAKVDMKSVIDGENQLATKPDDGERKLSFDQTTCEHGAQVAPVDGTEVVQQVTVGDEKKLGSLPQPQHISVGCETDAQSSKVESHVRNQGETLDNIEQEALETPIMKLCKKILVRSCCSKRVRDPRPQ
mmetsp:Transcript_14351/g.34652  ORF Transcript_14351/g.34652 Transcript_14351/m.34652 type:complete len:306 (-) Transcript_14351:2037-2954(-)